MPCLQLLGIFRFAGYTQGVFRWIQPIGMHRWHSGTELKHLHPAGIDRLLFPGYSAADDELYMAPSLFGMDIAQVYFFSKFLPLNGIGEILGHYESTIGQLRWRCSEYLNIVISNAIA